MPKGTNPAPRARSAVRWAEPSGRCLTQHREGLRRYSEALALFRWRVVGASSSCSTVSRQPLTLPGVPAAYARGPTDVSTQRGRAAPVPSRPVRPAPANNTEKPGGAVRHKTALQLADGSGWHYVNAGRDGGYPIGRCAGHPPHPTEAEARECYGAYVREDTIRLNAGTVRWTSCDHQTDGTRCPDPTRQIAKYGDDGYGQVALCPAHMTVESVIAAAQLDGPAGDAWIS